MGLADLIAAELERQRTLAIERQWRAELERNRMPAILGPGMTITCRQCGLELAECSCSVYVCPVCEAILDEQWCPRCAGMAEGCLGG